MTGRRGTVSARERSPRMRSRPMTTNPGRRTTRMVALETPPSSEEVNILKREKHNLIQEKSLLKAKITRLIDITKHPNRYTPRQNSDQNALEKEYKQVEQLSAYKRAEIASLNASDLAYLRSHCI